MAEHVKMLATLLETKVNKMLPFQYISGKFRTFYTVASFSLLSSAYEITYPSGNFRSRIEKGKVSVTKLLFYGQNLQTFCQTSIHPWTEVVYQILESKKALFYIFDSTGSVFENSKKPLF